MSGDLFCQHWDLASKLPPLPMYDTLRIFQRKIFFRIGQLCGEIVWVPLTPTYFISHSTEEPHPSSNPTSAN